jgi:hypothetical protein
MGLVWLQNGLIGRYFSLKSWKKSVGFPSFYIFAASFF